MIVTTLNILMLHSTAFPPEEGIGNYIYNLSTKLVDRGHNVSIITRGGLKEETFEYESFRVIKVPFIMAYPFHVDIHGFFVNRLLKTIAKDFDLIHVHMPLAPALTTRLPVVTTFHTPHFADFYTTDLVDVNQVMIKFLEIFDYRVEKSLISSSNVITAVSQGVKLDLERYYRINSEKVSVLGNAVSDNFLKAIPSLFGKKDPLKILYVGRLDYRKGLLDLIEGMKTVTREIPQARLVIIGKGPLLAQMIKKIINLNLQEKILLKGFVSREDLLSEYLTSSIFVLPSHYEGMATTALEAMSCGDALIATNVRGNSDVVFPNKTGLLVPKKEPIALANAIIYLLKNSDLRETLSKNARKLIEEKFTWEGVADRVVETYFKAIA
jgi:glycosyltransferase involved in cell wall biosynthesis